MNPGHNPDTEQRLISACMVAGQDGFTTAAGEGVVEAHFSDPLSRSCWRAATACIAEGRPPDVTGIYRSLAGLDGAAKPSPVEIAGLMDLEPTSVRLHGLIRDVIDLSRRRKLVLATDSAGKEAKNPARKEWGDVWEAVEPHLRAAQDASADTKTRSIAEVAASAKQQLLKPNVHEVIPTGFSGWDQHATPPRAGQLIVIGARPGGGKSAFAGQVAHYVATTDRIVAFFSLEMSAEEILTRMARLRTNPRPQFDDLVAAQLDELAELKTLRIYEVEHARTINQIEAICRLLASSPKRLGAVFIDYLQLVTPPADLKRENREQQVAAMSRAFKLLARTLKVPIFLLTQLNRDVEKDKGKNRKPRLSDLRESGSIEQDADRVWFLYPAKKEETEPLGADETVIDVMLYQAKCRNGPAGIEGVLRFNRRGMIFSPPPPTES